MGRGNQGERDEGGTWGVEAKGRERDEKSAKTLGLGMRHERREEKGVKGEREKNMSERIEWMG